MNPTSLRALVLDEDLEVGIRAREVLAAAGISVSLACSLQDLEVALGAGLPPDLLVINVTGGVGAWQIAERIRRSPFDGRILAFVDRAADPGVTYLEQIPRTECRPRPPSSLINPMLRQMVHELARTSTPFEPANRRSRVPAFHGMVGTSKPMRDIFSRIEKVAAGDASVCIYGESGTGKELIARAIHALSPRRDRPLITLDCTAVPESLMESHLFGHVKGAFTGAIEHREGVFSLAHTGTLFIDELCELPLSLQTKFLRVLQSREFTKVGGAKPIRTDVRLITATNRNPKKEVEAGSFREDLYYRVAVVMIRVPSLRERPEDILLLVEHFCAKFTTVYQKRIRGVSPRVMDRLVKSPWPGNVRQLEHFLEQAVVLGDGETLDEDDLPTDDHALAPVSTAPPLHLESALPLGEVERRYILRTLDELGGNRTRAARILGISVRCLQYKLRAFGSAGPPAADPRGTRQDGPAKVRAWRRNR